MITLITMFGYMNDPKLKCIQLAKKSTFRTKHGAVITYKGHIIGSGFNVNLSLPIIGQYNQHKTLHAEMVAMLRVKNKSFLKDCILYVCRLDNYNNLLLSKPCKVCMKLINSFGITNIVYSDLDNTWKKLSL